MKNQGLPPAVLALALAALVTAGMFAFWPRAEADVSLLHDSYLGDAETSVAQIQNTRRQGSVDATDGDPYFFVPATPVAVPPQLRLELALPELDPDQAYWLQKARIVAVCPLCASVDLPPVTLDDNALVVWLALLWTESRYQPWVEGPPLPNGDPPCCYGLGQLGFSLRTAETDASPELNLYVSLREFARLIDANGGDLMESVKNYKGVQTWDTEYQSNSVWSYIRIGAQ